MQILNVIVRRLVNRPIGGQSSTRLWFLIFKNVFTTERKFPLKISHDSKLKGKKYI